MEEFAYSLKQPNPTHQRKDVISILQHLFERNLIVMQGHEQVNVKSDYKHSLKTDSNDYQGITVHTENCNSADRILLNIVLRFLS